MQFGLRKLFLLTTVIAAAAALLKFVLPLGNFATLLLVPIAVVLMLRGWMLNSQGKQEQGSDYVAVGLLLLLITPPTIFLALLLFGP